MMMRATTIRVVLKTLEENDAAIDDGNASITLGCAWTFFFLVNADSRPWVLWYYEFEWYVNLYMTLGGWIYLAPIDF